MKKLILLIPLLILTGCSNKKEIFKENAKIYYENHMKMANTVESVTITLSDLRKAKEIDSSKLKKCKNTSKITFYLDKNTKEIKNAKIELNC